MCKNEPPPSPSPSTCRPFSLPVNLSLQHSSKLFSSTPSKVAQHSLPIYLYSPHARISSYISEASKLSINNRRATIMAQDSLKLVSPAIGHDGRLQRKYTADGQGAIKDVSPPLEWYGVPEAAKALALIVEDIDMPSEPNAPAVPWTHWVVTNIPPGIHGLPEGFSGKEEEMGKEYAGTKEGYNDHKVPGWRGPKHLTADHRIRFKLYALDEPLHLGTKVTKEKLLDAMEGHVIGEAELVALF